MPLHWYRQTHDGKYTWGSCHSTEFECTFNGIVYQKKKKKWRSHRITMHSAAGCMYAYTLFAQCFWAMHTLPTAIPMMSRMRACNACNIYIDKTTGSLPCTFDAHKYSHVYAYPPHFTYLLSDNRIFLWNGITVAEQSGIHQWNSCILLATFQMTCNRFSMQTIFVLK